MSLSLIREFMQRRRRRKENGNKAIGLDKQNNNFALASHFICTFLCRRCTTTTWNCLDKTVLDQSSTSKKKMPTIDELNEMQ